MSSEEWTQALLRMSRQDADDLDDLLAAHDPRQKPLGREVFPPIDPALAHGTEMKRPDEVVVGVKIVAWAPDLADRAVRLAAFALERDAQIVVLASGDGLGLERFGFRSERIAGEEPAERQACERQIRRFWNIDLVI